MRLCFSFTLCILRSNEKGKEKIRKRQMGETEKNGRLERKKSGN